MCDPKERFGNANLMSSQLPAPRENIRPSEANFPFQYRGHDILDLLKEARNYNRWLTDQVIAAKKPNDRYEEQHQ